MPVPTRRTRRSWPPSLSVRRAAARRRPARGSWSRSTALLSWSSLVDVALAVDPRRLEVERDAAAGARRCARRGELRVDGANPTDRPVRVGARRRAGARRCGRRRRRLRGTVPAGRRPARHRRRSARPAAGRFDDRATLVVRVDGPARPRRPPAPAAPCPALLRVHPAVPEPGRGRAAHQPGPHPRGRPAVGARAAAAAPSSTSCASTASTTSSAASTGRPPPGPARRSCAPTGPSGTRPCSCCSTTAG